MNELSDRWEANAACCCSGLSVDQLEAIGTGGVAELVECLKLVSGTYFCDDDYLEICEKARALLARIGR